MTRLREVGSQVGSMLTQQEPAHQDLGLGEWDSARLRTQTGLTILKVPLPSTLRTKLNGMKHISLIKNWLQNRFHGPG